MTKRGQTGRPTRDSQRMTNVTPRGAVHTVSPLRSKMVFAKEFLDLQVTFAEKVRLLCAIPFDHALFEYTNLYVRFGLGRDFDPEHDCWRAYVAGVATAGNVRDWTYLFYLNNAEANTRPAVVGTFGAFSYALSADGIVRLHFLSSESRGRSPIGKERDSERLADLATLSAHMRTTASAAAAVVGASWLYNIDAYRRLFPPVYAESRRVLHGRFRSMSLWGQFLNHRGQLNASMAQAFLLALSRCTRPEHIEQCFPFQVLTTRTSVDEFFEFYGV
jgi:hypothetical protein